MKYNNTRYEQVSHRDENGKDPYRDLEGTGSDPSAPFMFTLVALWAVLMML